MLNRTMASSSPEVDSPDEDEPMKEPTSDAGYMLALKVTPAGMTVCKKPLPPDDPTAKDTYDEIPVDSIEQGLKAVLKLYKENPVGAEEQAQFSAGFGQAERPVPATTKGRYA